MSRRCRRWVAGVFALALCTGADAKDFKLGLIVPGSHAWSQAAERMGEALEKRSDGEHTVSIFPSGQLGDESQMMRQLQTGALDMAFLTVAEMSNRVTDFGALYAPYLADNVAEADTLLHADTAQGLLEQLPRKAGVVGIGYGIATMRLMLTTYGIDDVGDIDGHKMRITPFDPIKDFYNILGAASTPMPLTDVYDAMANGQVDGVDADIELVWKLNLYDHADTLLYSNHMMFPMVGVVSGRVWANLGEADRKLVRETMSASLDSLFDQYVEVTEEMRRKVEGTDVEIMEVGPEFFGEKLDVWEQRWRERTPVLEELRADAERLL